MTPPRGLDDEGRELPTRPWPKCKCVIPVNRWPAKAGAIKRCPYQVLTFVEWCGHGVEVIPVPEEGSWLSEIPVLGIAT